MDKARKNCAAALMCCYKDFSLLADILTDDGQYRSFWMSPGEVVLECLCEDIYTDQATILIYELNYKNPRYCYGWPIAS